MASAIRGNHPIEVSDLKFLQLRKLNVASGTDSVPSDPINVVATSSRYGLVFVGINGGFKVLKLENVLDLDEDKENVRQPAENYSFQIVQSPTPSLMALSSDDMTLAVCYTRDSSVAADMYDIRAFADTESMPQPFLTVQLSSYPTDLQDFMWNPVNVEKYAYCLSDGSLHVHEILDTALNIVAGLPAGIGATSICWSPKGKQLVVGKKDGSFSQYKPTLQEVKKINAPKIDDSCVEVLNICWVSTTLFAVAYMVLSADSEPNVPCFVLVSTPKGAEVTYTSFGDVCWGIRNDRKLRYLMSYQPEWGVLICTSANSVETAIVGGLNLEKDFWQQWFLDGEGRAELPYDKKKETFPIGMSVIFCAQRRITLSETESYPPMPILFLLSTSGLLCPFHVLNTKPGSSNPVYPSEPITVEGERKAKVSSLAKAAVSPQSHAPTATLFKNSTNQTPNNPPQLIPSPISVLSQGNVWSPHPSELPNSKPDQMLLVKNNQPVQPLTSPSQSISLTPVQVEKTNQTFSGGRPVRSVITPHDILNPTNRPMAPGTLIRPQMFRTIPENANVRNVAPGAIHEPTILPGFQQRRPSEPAVPQALPLQPQVVKTSTAVVSKASPQTTSNSSLNQVAYSSVVLEEIKKFELQLLNLKKLFSKEFHVGSKDEMVYIKKNTLLLKDFHTDLVDTMQSLNLDIHNLKTASLESFAMIGEANSRSLKWNSLRSMTMLRDRSLDPMTTKRMQRIQQLYQYLSTQLHEVHDKLDRDLADILDAEKKKHKNKLRIPSTQAIYQTVVNNHNIIYNLRNYLDNFSKNYSKMKNTSVTKSHLLNINSLPAEGELEMLADVLLQDKPLEGPVKKDIGRKKLSSHIQSALREALSNRRITCVRPKVICDPSESQLLSSSILHPETRRTPKKDDTSKRTEKPEPASSDHTPVSSIPPISSTSTNTVAISPLDVKPMSAFSAKPGQIPIVGGITQGTPVARPFVNAVQKVGVPAGAGGMISRTLSFADASVNFHKPSSVKDNQNGIHTVQDVPSTRSSFAQSQMLAKAVYEDVTPPSSPDPGSGDALAECTSTLSSLPSFVATSDVPVSPSLSLAMPSENSTSPQATLKLPATKDGSSKYDSASMQVTRAETCSVTASTSSSVLQSFSLWEKNANQIKPANLPSPSAVKGSEADGAKPEREKTEVSNKDTSAISSSFQSAIPTSNTMLQFSLQKVRMPEISPEMDPVVSSSVADKSSPPQAYSFPNLSSSETNKDISKNVEKEKNESESVTTNTPSSINQVIKESTQSLPVSTAENVKTANSSENISSSDQATTSSETVIQSAVTTTATTNASTKSIFDSTFFNSQQHSTTHIPTGTMFMPANSTPSFFGQSGTSSSSFFGATPGFLSTTTATVTSKPPLCSQSPSDATITSTTSTTTSSFNQSPVVTSTTVTTAPAFGQGSVTTTTTTTTTPTTTFFSQPVNTQSSFFNKPAAVFGQSSVTPTTNATSVFGQNGASSFGKVATDANPFSATSPFGQNTSSFGQASPSSAGVFGQQAKAFGQTSSFFNQPNQNTAPGFGQKDNQNSATQVFGGQSSASAFTFGKSTFGQSAANTFGLAKAMFGESTNQPSGGAFNSSNEQQSVFGQSGFFTGLGGKPSEQDASKNVFGSSGTTAAMPAANLFGNQGPTSFGAKQVSFQGGSFSGGGGSVSQSGFGAFQQQAQKTGGFGSPPSFGSPPTFGGSPSFGSPPTFGAAQPSPQGNSPFGAAQASFSNFASAEAPTFGSLASQSSTFGNQSSGFAQQTNVFGSGGGGGGLFGSGGSSTSFGQQSGFGSPSSGNSAFTQWRN